MSVLYSLGKANVVVDALSRLSMNSVAHIEEGKKELVSNVHRLAKIDVKAKQGLDPILVELKEAVLKKFVEAFSQVGDGVLRYQCRLCVPNVNDLREEILPEAHSSQYSIHPGVTKMCHDLREVYWWNGMNKNSAKFVAKCPNFQQVKVEHQKP
ncbi:hypothetical protein MTR67_052398 [Solanum verrucosum]|uniref:Integrase zinc-binding domain-containing protein n=1 Tax=Solanum verrucosum TaxID=315347 RepID=A0AAF1A2V1_SOLVR|nr:hypothetical protein MTR67_052398 [Solanum verrucosum]